MSQLHGDLGWVGQTLASVCPNLSGAVLAFPTANSLLPPGLSFLSRHSIFIMSQVPSTSTSTPSPNFQSIFKAALKAYEKKTKKDLLAHPLAAQLQACNSPSDILAVLQDKINEFDQSRSADERLSKWLNPTINVLFSFSATIGAGVGHVSTTKVHPPSFLTCHHFSGILARISHLLWYWSPPLGENRYWSLCRGDSHCEVHLRRPKTSKRAKMRSSISSSVLRTSSNASRLIPQCRRQKR